MKMKFLLFIIPVLTTACVQADSLKTDKSAYTSVSVTKTESLVIQKYNEQIKQCDNDADKKLNAPDIYTNTSMRRAVYEQISCYEDIVKNIIERNYTQNKQEMLKNFDVFMTSTHQVSYGIYFPDDCNPSCGTIAQLEAVVANLEIIRSYLNILISRQDPVVY